MGRKLWWLNCQLVSHQSSAVGRLDEPILLSHDNGKALPIVNEVHLPLWQNKPSNVCSIKIAKHVNRQAHKRVEESKRHINIPTQESKWDTVVVRVHEPVFMNVAWVQILNLGHMWAELLLVLVFAPKVLLWDFLVDTNTLNRDFPGMIQNRVQQGDS